MKKWECVVCGLIYDEAKGWPDDGIAPGTRWDDVPDDWLCPDCGVGKEDFDMVEVSDAIDKSDVASDTLPNSTNITPASTAPTNTAPIVIVGTGMAGYGLAKELRKHDQETPLVIISSDDGRGYSKPLLSTAFTRNVSASDLTQFDAGSIGRELNASVWPMTKVVAIDTKQQVLTLSVGNATITYAKLVLALGAEVHKPAIDGDDNDLVYSVNDLDDYAEFRKAIEKNDVKKVCIIGAGLIGCEFTNDLLNGGFEVEVVDPLEFCMPTLLPEIAGKAVQSGLEQNGAKFHFGAFATQFSKADRGVIVTLSSGEKIKADLVLSAIGVRPRIGLASDAGLKVNRGVVTDQFLQTSEENVFALGDCAEVVGHVLVYVAPLMASVRALAKTLSGAKTKVSYPAMPVAVKTPACPVVVSPAPRGVDGEWTVKQLPNNSIRAEFRDLNDNLLGFALTADAVGSKSDLQSQLPDIL